MSRVARNTLLNLAGEVAPLIAALVAIPVLLSGIGVDRFGLLGIAWMVIGYAGLFEFGLGRALTKIVSERMGTADEDDVPGIVWASLLTMLGLGVVGAILLATAAPWMTGLVRMPAELRAEALQAFRILAWSLPAIIVSVGLRGVLEALHRFDLSNAVRLPAGVFAFLGPLLVLPFSTSLVAVVAVLTAGRIAACIAYLALCVRALPSLRDRVRPQWGTGSGLLAFGGWMTVSNIVSPLMTVFDRFIIGALISTEAAAYYATPYDIISKMLIVSGALSGVLFPTFAGQLLQDRPRASRLFGRSVTYVFLVLFPVTLVCVAFSREGLTLWVGSEVAGHSAPVLQVLAVAILINAVALVPFTVIQAAGRPDITAKLHLIELPLYLALMLFLTRRYGIVGAAIASGIRMTADALCLFAFSRSILGYKMPVPLIAGVAFLSALTLGGFAWAAGSLITKSFAIVVALALFVAVAFSRVVSEDDRALFARLKAQWLGAAPR
jgi:O-antigen/teichoic acid export membrane protein